MPQHADLFLQLTIVCHGQLEYDVQNNGLRADHNEVNEHGA